MTHVLQIPKTRRTPAWIRYRSPAITPLLQRIAGSLAISAGLVNLLDFVSRIGEHQAAGAAAVSSIAEIAVGVLIFLRPSRQLLFVMCGGTFLLLAVSWLAYMFGLPSPRLDTRDALAATGALGRGAELALLLVLSIAITRRQAPTSPRLAQEQSFAGLRMPRLSMRRASLIMLSTFAAAALSPLPTAVLERVSPGDRYGVESAAAQSSTFLETFDGNPSAPQRFQSPNWDISLTAASVETNLIWPMDAHHGPGCEPPLVSTTRPFDPSSNPLVTHRIDQNNQTVFLCRDHLMTAVSHGYAAAYLTPNRMADFSQGESVIRFDMSTLRTSSRDWVDFVIMPFDDNQQLNFQSASIPPNAIHIEMFNVVGSSSFRANVYREFQRTSLRFNDVPYDSFLTPDPARRDTFEIRISRNHLRFGMPAYNFWWVDTDISPALNWNQGIVQLNHRSYNPGKDDSPPCSLVGGCRADTWHWDNFSVAPAAPFTMIHANQEVAGPSSPQLTFPQSSPTNAHLRFSAQTSTRAGQNLQFSIDGGRTWQDTQLQRDGQPNGDELFKSYWTSIPAGVTNVQLRRADGSNSWRARDASIWAPGASASSSSVSPTTTSTPSSSTAVPPTNTPLATTATRTPVPPTAAPTSPATATPGSVGSTATGPGTRLPWQGSNWYVQGANVPWLNWGCDFGCGTSTGVSSAASQSALSSGFGQLRSAGAHSVRWWMFEGNPWQITRDSSGAPTGINPTVYTDIDAALRLADQYDLYYDFVLFSAPTAIPNAWVTNAGQRARLAAALAPLFAHYRGNPRIVSWEVFNEPEYDIWNNQIAQAPVQATVRAIVDAIHANSTAYATVGSAMLDGLPMWVGMGLDYYQAHWYPSMSSGNWCVPCTDYATVRARYGLDAPLVIGELYGGSDVDAIGLYNDLYASGYAGGWAWSLFPNSTGDHLAIDMTDLTTFNGQHTDIGPRSGATGSAVTPTSVPAVTRTPTNTAVPASPTRVPNTATAVPPTATAVPPVSTRVPATSTPLPTPMASSGPITVTFNDLTVGSRDTALNGTYPGTLINWGTGMWEVSPPWGQMSSTNLEFSGASTAGTLTLSRPMRLASLKVYNGGTERTTLSLSCPGQETKRVQLKARMAATIDLGMTRACTSITLSSTNGSLTHFDDLAFTN